MPGNSVFKGLVSGSTASADQQLPTPAAPPAGGSVAGSKYADDPAFQVWRSQNPHVPEVVMDNAYENSKSQGAQSIPMTMHSSLTQVDPYQNLANKATGKMFQ